MTAFMDIGSSTPMLATMIGLAVGIDYALFILARYRSELEHTDDREEAVGIAVGTAGSAVVFAGLTVLIALSALAVVRIPFLTAMGLAAAGTVLIAVLVALTLLPAILGLMQVQGVRRPGAPLPPRGATRDGRILNNGVRWARLVGRAPVAVVLLVVVGLGALALPLQSACTWPSRPTAPRRPTPPSARPPTWSPTPSARAARRRCWSSSTAGTCRPPTGAAAYGDVAAWAAGQDGVVNAQVVAHQNERRHRRPGAWSPRRRARTTPPPRTCSLDLRDGQAGIEEETGTTTGVTGLTAITTDVSERLSDALPIYLAVVIGLAFLLLMVVFRSILVPLTATLGFLLSVLATLGATVAVFQEGAFGLMEGQPIVSFMPIFLIGVVFGLAMDYQVFLVTRMREAHVHGASTARGGRRRLPQQRPGGRRRGGDHDVGLRGVHAAGRADRQVDGLRARRRRGLRRVRGADDADPGADVPARREGLVAAGAGSTGSCRTWTSRARSCTART